MLVTISVTWLLMSLARALDVSEEYLLGEQDLALDGVEFRKKADMSAKEEAQVESHVHQLLERYLTVEEILGLPVEWDEPRDAPYPVMQNVGEADRAARILREHWGLGLDPIPILVELLESRLSAPARYRQGSLLSRSTDCSRRFVACALT